MHCLLFRKRVMSLISRTLSVLLLLVFLHGGHAQPVPPSPTKFNLPTFFKLLQRPSSSWAWNDHSRPPLGGKSGKQNVSSITEKMSNSDVSDLTKVHVQESPQNQALQQALTKYFKNIRQFLSNEPFNSAKFSRSLFFVAGQLSEIKEMVSGLTLMSTRLSNEFIFASRMLDIMVLTTQISSQFHDPEKRDHKLIRWMMNLHVRLYSLCNNEGALASSTKCYSDKVITAWKIMCLLAEDFEDLREVSLSTRAIFWERKKEAEKMIEDLWAQIPD